MSTSTPLLIGLTGIAGLADVQRPVASMWRTRFARTDDPFPLPVEEKGGRPLFDALDVARWLERTDHGNNPDAVADAAASATPAGFEIANEANVSSLDALLTLKALTGERVGGVRFADTGLRAEGVDPRDEFLLTEIRRALPEWADWADELSDAAYSPSEGARRIEARHAATRSAAGTAGPLTTHAEQLLLTMAAALAVTPTSHLNVGEGIEPSFAAALLRKLGDDIDVSVNESAQGRGIRRRLLSLAVPVAATERAPRLHLLRMPSEPATRTPTMLRRIDEIALSLGDDDRALVLAPAQALTDALTGDDDRLRSDALRSGRVRAVIRLAPGLVSTAPREALGVWVLGPTVGDVPIADRFTAVADLTDVALTPAARADLTSDVLAAMGSARAVRAHAFRFARLARTTSLLASRGSLVAHSDRRHSRTDIDARQLPALIDQALSTLGVDAPAAAPTAASIPAVPPARVDTLIAEGHLRMISGTRVTADELSENGLVAVTATDLDDTADIGRHCVDPLKFASRHPSARLTNPGDIVFRTAPTPRAWVDLEGSKIVVFPARVLRITAADPGGLVAELVAADIAQSRGGAGAWRRWMLRRVAPASIAPLREALADFSSRRAELTRRLDALDTYSDLLTAGVVSGVVMLPDPAANAASDPQ